MSYSELFKKSKVKKIAIYDQQLCSFSNFTNEIDYKSL
jgi:hypothetical protein